MHLLGGRVTLGEQAFGQILTLSDHPSYKGKYRCKWSQGRWLG